MHESVAFDAGPSAWLAEGTTFGDLSQGAFGVKPAEVSANDSFQQIVAVKVSVYNACVSVSLVYNQVVTHFVHSFKADCAYADETGYSGEIWI